MAGPDADRAAAFDHEQFESSLVWMLGAPRTGSSWLLGLLGEHPRTVTFNETLVFSHLAPFSPSRIAPQLGPDQGQVSHQDVVSEHSAYLLSPRYEDAWRPPLRDLILGRLWAQTAEMAERSRIAAPVVVIKEPTGSESADLLLRVLPGARLLVLHRDGRDVMDSELAALAPGTWATPLIGGRELGSEERLDWIRRWAALWLLRMEGLQRAYDERPHEQRMMIRYEDLLDDTPASVRALYDWLGLEISDAELDAVVARNDFASIPAELTGPKHFARAATPGLWRKNLSAAEQELLHELIGSKLRELGYED